MSKRSSARRTISPAARVFTQLQADEALLPGETSMLRRSGALFLALLVLGAVPLFWAANAVGVLGDVPAAVAHSGSSGSGSDGDEDNSGPGGDGDDDDDDSAPLNTDETSVTAASTVGTTADADTATQTDGQARAVGTNDTSANGDSTRGTTNDNDTRTKLGTDDTSANGTETSGTTNDNDTRTAGTNTAS